MIWVREYVSKDGKNWVMILDLIYPRDWMMFPTSEYVRIKQEFFHAGGHYWKKELEEVEK